MRSMKVVLTLCIVSFVTHFVWEWLHISLYTNYQALGTGWSLTLYATLGDVLYTFGAVVLVALFKYKLLWIPRAQRADYVGLSVLGALIAAFVEYKALVLHRWAYAASMPLLWGVGLSPLLQMAILLPLSVYVARRMYPYK